MKLLDDIIEGAVSDTQPIGTVLRKCLLLERQVKNEKFRIWLDNELDGYDNIDELPDYRTFDSISRGFFVGFGGSQINDQPLSLHVMEKNHQKLVDKVRLSQPAASYEGGSTKATDASLPWPPILTTMYQKKFIANFVLNRAWQEVPGSCIVGLVETVRNRILRFALDIQDQLGEDKDSASQLPAETVERSVINNIYGGNVFIAAHAETISQVAQTNIVAGDTGGLFEALSKLGVTEEGIKALKHDIEADKQDGQPSLGPKTMGWLTDIGKYLGTEGVKIGVEVAKKAATKWIMQQFGLDI
jgi:AbiTii